MACVVDNFVSLTSLSWSTKPSPAFFKKHSTGLRYFPRTISKALVLGSIAFKPSLNVTGAYIGLESLNYSLCEEPTIFVRK